MSFVDVNSRIRNFSNISFAMKIELLYVDYTRFESWDIESFAKVLFDCKGMDKESMVCRLINEIRERI